MCWHQEPQRNSPCNSQGALLIEQPCCLLNWTARQPRQNLMNVWKHERVINKTKETVGSAEWTDNFARSPCHLFQAINCDDGEYESSHQDWDRSKASFSSLPHGQHQGYLRTTPVICHRKALSHFNEKTLTLLKKKKKHWFIEKGYAWMFCCQKLFCSMKQYRTSDQRGKKIKVVQTK